MTPLGTPVLDGFYTGFINPFLVPAHVLVLVGLGLMIGRQSSRLIAFTAFAAGLAAGLVALAHAVGQTSAPMALLVGAVAVGLITAAGVPLPLVVGAPLAAAIGMAVGLDSPPQATSLRAAYAALVGTGVGAALLVGTITMVAGRMTRPWQRIGVRLLGSWVAASALMVLALRLVR